MKSRQVPAALVGAALTISMTAMVATANASPGRLAVTRTDLVSDQPGVAQLTDPHLVNGWGLSNPPGGPMWVSNNGDDTSTLYIGGAPGVPVSPAPSAANQLVVSIPGGGAPTGQVFNSTTAFPITANGVTASARFIFAGEDGDISGWNPTVDPTHAVIGPPHSDDAIYKGLALIDSSAAPRLLVTDFRHARIDMYDGNFHLVTQPAGAFTDRAIPSSYAPFNVAVLDGLVYVTYAKPDDEGEDDVPGAGHGFVAVYTQSGRLVSTLVRHGELNSPWGLEIAPSSWGPLAGDLLVGNFGDGRIHAYDPFTGRPEGTLRGANHRPIEIEGLWGLRVGTAAAGGPDAVWFSAGPDDESHGLLGVLRPAS
jgi:uncharacterized protein (TIGR03118 family)